MNKRGQAYILAAIIVCLVAFLLVSKPNVIRERVSLENFESISNNYLIESPKVVNDVLEERGIEDISEVGNKLEDFNQKFLEDYARNQDPNFGLIYIYTDKNGMVIQNYLKNEKVVFLGQEGGAIEVLLGDETQIESVAVFEGTGANANLKTNLCEYYEGYCMLSKNKIPNGPIILKIGEAKYEFEITPESPELIAIVKSSAEDGTVKVEVSEEKI